MGCCALGANRNSHSRELQDEPPVLWGALRAQCAPWACSCCATRGLLEMESPQCPRPPNPHKAPEMCRHLEAQTAALPTSQNMEENGQARPWGALAFLWATLLPGPLEEAVVDPSLTPPALWSKLQWPGSGATPCRWPEQWGCRAKGGDGTPDHMGGGLLAVLRGRGGGAARDRAPQQEGEGRNLSPHSLPLAKSKKTPMPCSPGLEKPPADTDQGGAGNGEHSWTSAQSSHFKNSAHINGYFYTQT